MVVKGTGPHSQTREQMSGRLLNLSVPKFFLNKMMLRMRMKETAYCVVMLSTEHSSIDVVRPC